MARLSSISPIRVFYVVPTIATGRGSREGSRHHHGGGGGRHVLGPSCRRQFGGGCRHPGQIHRVLGTRPRAAVLPSVLEQAGTRWYWRSPCWSCHRPSQIHCERARKREGERGVGGTWMHLKRQNLKCIQERCCLPTT
jgi:hypothetical protein